MPSRHKLPRDHKHSAPSRRPRIAGARRRQPKANRGRLGRIKHGAASRASESTKSLTVRSSRAILTDIRTRAATALKGAARRIAQFTHRTTSALITGQPSSERAFPGVPGSRRQWLATGVLLLVLPLLSLALEGLGNRSAAKAAELKITQTLALPDQQTPALPSGTESTEATWDIQRVGKGDTLAAVFQRLGLGPGVVHRVVHLNETTERLTRIYPGDELAFQLNDSGELAALEYQLSEDQRLRIHRVDGKLTSEIQQENLVTQLRHTGGVIRGSLFRAGREAGLSDRLIMDMAGLFGWDIDFVLDIRRGDEFHLIYEELYRNGEFLRAGDIVAATFINQGENFQAVRFTTENGEEYFSPDGRNMRKAFLRAPLNFSYISSNFNPSRFHPILQRVKAHNGTDYRAPTGTPVFAAGHGKVVASARNKYNGHYVFIQHGNNIVTKYLHFTKRAVRKGQRVKQGQVIGYVGMTGLAQAPHLHYEFLVNGVHRNPRTVDLPKADPLPKAELAAFQQVATPLLNQLELIQGRTLLAAKD
ncbi:MAG: peptidoglycan DD-metalloendopeptidase family protein [Pseudomonadota bacterium]